MGTMIQSANPSLDDFQGLEGCNEVLNITRPELIADIHRQYFSAGVDAVETNTFGANLANLGEYDIPERIYELAEAGARIARGVADEFTISSGEPKWVLGSLGPGTKLPTLGHTTYEDLRAAYQEASRGLIDGGSDALLIETTQDLLQAKAAVNGARAAVDNCDKDILIIAQVTVETTGTMLLGSEISAALSSLQSLGVDLIGMNCATGPAEMSEHLRTLSKSSPVGISVMPNAGLPILKDGGAYYPLGPDELAISLDQFVKDYSVGLIGGCCGTTPEHLAAVVRKVHGTALKERAFTDEAGASSLYQFVPFRQQNTYLAIGERTNANGSRAFRDALLSEDWQKCVDIAKDQVREGAHMLDLSVDYVGRDGVKDMRELASRFATATTLPIVLDSTEPAVILNPAARIVLNSVFLAEAVKAGLDSAIVHPSKISPIARIPEEQREVALDLIYDRRKFEGDDCVYDPLSKLLELFAGVEVTSTRQSRAAELAALPIEKRLVRRIIDGEKAGLEVDLDQARLGGLAPLAIINDYLLEGMKEVGELFGR
ncbi:MAG: methionine synthase, partial [Actinobacteria bacterium]|nr:methionine synthase [Actinomycetota bacterium]